MRIFLDTNILVELIENRSSADYVYEIISHCATDEHQLFISIGGFYTLTYLIDRHLKQDGLCNPERLMEVKKILRFILQTCDIANLDKEGLAASLENDNFVDLEDSYQYQAAKACKADVLLTINIRDFRGVEKDSLPIMTPATFVAHYMRVS